MTATAHVASRLDPNVALRLARSAETLEGSDMATSDVVKWLDAHRARAGATVTQIPFDELDQWSFAPSTGNLHHRTGRFFTVEGVHSSQPRHRGGWHQPIIMQPDIGILGILAKEIDGVLHFLMQAKFEPGNPNLVQLSPTVQATRSNYTKAHGGSEVRHLEHFLTPDGVLADVLQSEHGAWFYRKRNRNMIVEVQGEVEDDDAFRWFTLGQVRELLKLDNVVNMDARTVLASGPRAHPSQRARSSDTELLSWFTGERARHEVATRPLPLSDVVGWTRDDRSIHRTDARYFRVVAVSVEGAGREVASWTQPMIEPVGPGIIGFAYREFDGVPHVLVHARIECGFLDTVELSPTVQCTPSNYTHLPAAERPTFLDLFRHPPAGSVRYSAIHSEEGGRFLNAESRYLIVETDESMTPAAAPPGFRWVTPSQLQWLAGHSRYVNVQARSLLAVL